MALKVKEIEICITEKIKYKKDIHNFLYLLTSQICANYCLNANRFLWFCNFLDNLHIKHLMFSICMYNISVH